MAMLGFIVGFITASALAILMAKKQFDAMRKANVYLRNESDFYFLLQKIHFKNLHHHDQELFNIDPEVMGIKRRYQLNNESIAKTGKY